VIEQIFLVRHGETLDNAAGIVQGWSNSDLSEKGREQVRQLASRIADYGPTALYSSPLGRAMSTAEAIAEVTGLQVRTVDDLREMNYGGWENRSFLDVRRTDEDLYLQWINDPECRCPNGESHGEVRRRMERAFASVETARPILVAHGTAIRVGATVLLGVPVMTSRHLAQDNAALNVFLRRGERWILKQWNDTTHCLGPKDGK
jgi:broad specificity phosphatase PhoE